MAARVIRHTVGEAGTDVKSSELGYEELAELKDRSVRVVVAGMCDTRGRWRDDRIAVVERSNELLGE